MRPKPGHVYWVPIPVRGTNERKRRPALVVSTEQYSQGTGLVQLVPISTHPKGLRSLPVRMKEGRLDDPRSHVVVDVMVSEDVEFLQAYVGSVQDELFLKVIEGVQAMLARSP